MKSYPKYKPTNIDWIGEIPEHWNFKKLKNETFIVKEQIGVDFFKNENVIHYSIPNIQNFGVGQLEHGKEIDSSKLVFKGGEVLISKLNPRKSTVTIVQKHSELIVGSGEFLAFVPKKSKEKYLYYFFINQRFTDFLDSAVESVTRSHQRVSPDEVYNCYLTIPPLPEQQAIVTYLDQKTALIDELIGKKERKIELLKENRTALINHAVTKGLDPTVKFKDSGIEWIGEIPEHWSLVKVGHLTKIIRGASPRPAGDPLLFDGDFINWITVGSVTNSIGKYVLETDSFLTEAGMAQSRIVEPETLLISNSGATLGVPKILKIRGCINDGSVAFLDLKPVLQRDFLYYFLVSQTDLLREQQSGYGQPNLNTDIIANIRFPLPPIEEQILIIEFLDSNLDIYDQNINLELQKIENLKEYRQSLISNVVTGKICVLED